MRPLRRSLRFRSASSRGLPGWSARSTTSRSSGCGYPSLERFAVEEKRYRWSFINALRNYFSAQMNARIRRMRTIFPVYEACTNSEPPRDRIFWGAGRQAKSWARPRLHQYRYFQVNIRVQCSLRDHQHSSYAWLIPFFVYLFIIFLRSSWDQSIFFDFLFFQFQFSL